MFAAGVLGIEAVRLQDQRRRPGPNERLDSGASNTVIAAARASNHVNFRIDVHPATENPRIQ